MFDQDPAPASSKEPVPMFTNDYLRQIYLSQKKQEGMSRVRMIVQLVTSAAVLGLLLALVWQIVPLVTPVVQQIDDLSTTVNTLAADIKVLVDELNAADLGGTVEETRIAVNEARAAMSIASASMQTAVDDLNKMDFDALNKSIQGLSAVVEVLSKLFGG